jgi:hypothetical protein
MGYQENSSSNVPCFALNLRTVPDNKQLCNNKSNFARGVCEDIAQDFARSLDTGQSVAAGIRDKN